MRLSAKVGFVVAMAVLLAGCVLTGKTKTAVAPPPPKTTTAATTPAEPLSIPQTNVDLPSSLKVEAAALETAPPPAPAPQAQTKPPAPKLQVPARAAATQTRPAEATSQEPPPTETPAEPRKPIQEILSPEEQNKLRESAHTNQAEAKKLLAAVKPHSADQQRTWAEVDQFVKQSVQAETAGDMRLASQLAERANVLAKDLQSGK